MCTKNLQKKHRFLPLFFSVAGLLFTAFSPPNAIAQSLSIEKNERATLKLSYKQKGNKKGKATTRIYEAKPNQIGLFNRIANIEPLAKVPIEVAYPEGKAGEKVLVSVLDGGKLDNGKGVRVVTVNSQKKISFTFQVNDDPGLYRLSLSKGYDTKIVQLWVGPEPSPFKSTKN